MLINQHLRRTFASALSTYTPSPHLVNHKQTGYEQLLPLHVVHPVCWVDTTNAPRRLPVLHPPFFPVARTGEAPEAPTSPVPPTYPAGLRVSTWNILQEFPTFSTDEPVVIVPPKWGCDYKHQDSMGLVLELDQFPQSKISELMRLMLAAKYNGRNDMCYEDMVDLLNSQEGIDKATNLDGIAEIVLMAFQKLNRLLDRANATVYLNLPGVAETSRLYPLTGSNKHHMFINGGDEDPVMCGQQRFYTATNTNQRTYLNETPKRLHASLRDVPLIKELSKKVVMDSAKNASYIVAVQHNNAVQVIGMDSSDLEKALGMKASYFSPNRNIKDPNW